jgi:predicted enzyme related to lactoylglutathione lyase
LRRWYRDNLGVPVDDSYGGASFERDGDEDAGTIGMTVWSAFPATTRYFDPSSASFMINYRVRDLDAMLEQLRRAGAPVDDKIEESEYGRFGWAMDPEGNRIELWEPAKA